MTYARRYYIEGEGWTEPDYFKFPGDLYIETMDLWNCEDFSMELLDWCEHASVGDIYKDDDIIVQVCE